MSSTFVYMLIGRIAPLCRVRSLSDCSGNHPGWGWSASFSERISALRRIANGTRLRTGNKGRPFRAERENIYYWHEPGVVVAGGRAGSVLVGQARPTCSKESVRSRGSQAKRAEFTRLRSIKRPHSELTPTHPSGGDYPPAFAPEWQVSTTKE